jgi:hypothetical protein
LKWSLAKICTFGSSQLFLSFIFYWALIKETKFLYPTIKKFWYMEHFH